MVERVTRCIVGWCVEQERSERVLQELVDAAPQALIYFSDAFPTYESLLYKPGIHLSLPNKCQTYSVEADNAELRHYLARLTRRSRCFSRSISALQAAIKLFVHAWNRRQIYRLRFPGYPSHLFQFVNP
jgi:insertion element IS1 protein InsB